MLIPLNVMFVSQTYVGFKFIQNPSYADSMVLQVSHREFIHPATNSKYFCETLSAKYHETNHVMIKSVSYEMSYSDENVLLLTSIDGSVTTLSTSNKSRDCMDAMVPTSSILAPHLSDVVIPVAYSPLFGTSKDQLVGWSKVAMNATTFDAYTGVATGHGTIVPSPLAIAACPSCIILRNYDGDQYWFATPGVKRSAYTKLVNQKGEIFAPDWETQSGMVHGISVSKTYFSVRSENGFGAGLLCLYQKGNHSVVDRQLQLPDQRNLHCNDVLLSPDETRVLAYCSFHYQPFMYHTRVYQWILMELSIETGALVKVRTLPPIHMDDWSDNRYYGGSRFGNEAILARVDDDMVHIYQFTD